MVLDCFHRGGILPLIRQVLRIAVMTAGWSRFQAEYLSPSGPGAEFAFIFLMTPDSSSPVIGVSMMSVGVGLVHSWRGGLDWGVASFI